MATILSATEVQSNLSQLNNWALEDNVIKTVKIFDGFPNAISFVNKLVEPAESAGHHPDLEISYNKVTICLTTHDVGGLTQKDFEMAKQIEAIVL